MVWSVAFSPDGSTVADGDDDGRVQLYNRRTGRRTLLLEGSSVYTVAFDPRGTTLASGDADGQILLYDRSSKRRTTLREGSVVNDLVFSPDGAGTASGDDSGRVVVLSSFAWSASVHSLKRRLCAELGETNMTRSQWRAYVPGQPYRRTCP